MRVSPLLALGAALCSLFSMAARAGVAAFDLAGPDLRVTVSRGHETLPIAEVPNLAVGERLWIRADLPASESEHYLLIVAFLRGATNPPPRSWFHDCATWKGACAHKGMRLRVPPGAGQVLVFLAPQTGGDFRTLVGAVRGRPGAFVRTSQDLNQATLDISRLDRCLAAIPSLDESAPQELGQAAPKLARSLAIQVKANCLQRIPQLQAPCLMQGGSIATDPGFRHAVQVPDGFPGYALPVPHPRDGELYVKLRDDPSVINTASLAEHLLPGPQQTVHARERHAAARKPTRARGRHALRRVADTPTGGEAASASSAFPNMMLTRTSA